MNIHLFISQKAAARSRLRKALNRILSTQPVIEYSRIEAIDGVMPAGFDRTVISVVMVGKNDELVRLYERKAFFERTRTILILPDNRQETLTLGHALKPRFVTFMTSDFSDVAAVIENMMAQSPNDEGKKHAVPV